MFSFVIDPALFQSTLPMRGATFRLCPGRPKQSFQSTLPMRGATRRHTNLRSSFDFNPRSLCGERHVEKNDLAVIPVFQSTLPMRGATFANSAQPEINAISIHAPYAGSDLEAGYTIQAKNLFQSTLPMRGATAGNSKRPRKLPEFQSTLPMRGATQGTNTPRRGRYYFNPRSLCGERPRPRRKCRPLSDISIHAPYAGSDVIPKGATDCADISIHAPYAGSDVRILRTIGKVQLFQSTLPMRGATCSLSRVFSRSGISIHAPYAGSDILNGNCNTTGYFNPRSLCGERPVALHTY